MAGPGPAGGAGRPFSRPDPPPFVIGTAGTTPAAQTLTPWTPEDTAP